MNDFVRRVVDFVKMNGELTVDLSDVVGVGELTAFEIEMFLEDKGIKSDVDLLNYLERGGKLPAVGETLHVRITNHVRESILRRIRTKRS